MRILFAVSLAFGVAIVFPPTRASSQQVRGQVLDPDRVPVSTAEIRFRIEDGTVVLGMVSDRDGRFRTVGIEAGRYWVEVDRLGYASTQIGPLALSAGDSIEVELIMAVDAVPLEPIIVVASSRPVWEHLEPPALWEFWERKDHYGKLGLGHFLTYEELKTPSGVPGGSGHYAVDALPLSGVQREEAKQLPHPGTDGVPATDLSGRVPIAG